MDELGNKVVDSFTVDTKRIAMNDYRYAIQKLVEITLRAVSSGINDPNTAIKCLHFLGVILGKISTVEGCFNYIENEESRLVVVYESFNFKKDLENILSQIVYYGKEDLSVVTAVYDSLITAFRIAKEENKEIIRDYANYVYESTIENFDLHRDREILEKKYEKLNRIEGEL